MTHPATSEPATPQTRQKPTQVWRTTLAALVGAGAITTLVLWLQPPSPRFELITASDYERRTKRFAFIRDARAWMTRFSPKIFGFAPVHISAGYIVTVRGVASELGQLPPPAFSTDAMKVWILPSNEVARIERDLRNDNMTRWRLNTSEGIPSVLSTATPTPIGTGPGLVEFANHPGIRSGNVDLAAKFMTVVMADPQGQIAAPATNQVAFRAFLKRDEGAIVSNEAGALFIWAHAP